MHVHRVVDVNILTIESLFFILFIVIIYIQHITYMRHGENLQLAKLTADEKPLNIILTACTHMCTCTAS